MKQGEAEVVERQRSDRSREKNDVSDFIRLQLQKWLENNDQHGIHRVQIIPNHHVLMSCSFSVCLLSSVFHLSNLQRCVILFYFQHVIHICKFNYCIQKAV